MIDAIVNAKTINELHRISLNLDSTPVILAINAAKRRGSASYFDGLSVAALRKIIKNRFTDLKKDREKELLGVGSNSQPNWTDELSVNKQGKIESNLANFTLMLRHHPQWKGVLGFSEFSANIVIRRSPPWGYEAPDTAWDKTHTTKARVWFTQQGAVSASKDMTIDAVESVAQEKPFHPVREYFDSLAWDGTVRLNRWLTTYFHVQDSPYTRAVGVRWLISSVARIYKPGEKVDHLLVLEGPQGRKRKSQMVRALVPNPEWFTDQLSNVTSKDAKMEVAGVMIIELAEMEVLTRASSSAMKKFVTHQIDRFRPPYGRHLIKWPRQFVFIGTMNPVPGEGYLKDPTGARRFWPVRCLGRDMTDDDMEMLKRDRDQLWAEAVHRYKAGEKWWLETPELETLATVEQDERRARDEWELPVCEWVGQRNEVTVREVIKGALGLSASHSAEIRVVKILKHHLGFKQCRPEQKGKRYVCYRREQLLDSAPKHTAPKHTTPKHTAPKRKRPKLRRRPPRKNHRGR